MILRLCLIFFIFTTQCNGIQLFPKYFSKDYYVEPAVYEVNSIGDEPGFFDFDNFYNKFVYDLIPDSQSSNDDKVENYVNTKDYLTSPESNQSFLKKTIIK
uniref:Uncharacterized protein n=1 Tax=Strongyloides venezuelensis TaxID=75913 RepID=A0A0K0FF29_STRVS